MEIANPGGPGRRWVFHPDVANRSGYGSTHFLLRKNGFRQGWIFI